MEASSVIVEPVTQVHPESLPTCQVGSEIKPGMKKVFFPAQTLRSIHVSRGACAINNRNHAVYGAYESHPAILISNFPTCIVIDEHGQKHRFHAVILQGPAALKYEPKPDNRPQGVNATMYLVTTGAIEGYVDPDGYKNFDEIDGCTGQKMPD